jgi:hypothetical protein
LFYEEAARVTVAGQLALVILGYCKSALENMRASSEFSEFPVKKTLDVVEWLHRSKIELIVTRHDQPAAFVAATFGRLTGKPGVCISTLGPGMLNFCFISSCVPGVCRD